MTAKVDDEDYWNSSENNAFSFEDDEVTTASSLFQPERLAGTGRFQEISSFNTIEVLSDKNEIISSAKPLATLISKRSLAVLLSNNAPASCVVDSKEELVILRRQVNALFEPPPIEMTVKSIILEKPYSLHLYKSFDLKAKLLDEAVQSGDGNAILAVVLFLRNTLKKKLFYNVLQTKPAALPVLINYLCTTYKFRCAVDILSALGHLRDAAMRDFQLNIHPGQSVDKRSRNLRNLYRDHFSASDVEDKQFLDNFTKCVEWQKGIASLDQSLCGTVAEALAYLCLKHWNDLTLSPQHFVTLLNINERLYHSIALSSLAAKENWKGIENLLFTKGWLGAKKMKSVIPAEKIITQLHQLKIPEPFLLEFFELVDSSDKKMALAQSLSWHRGVIDTYLAMKDRQGLELYQTTLNPNSNDYLHAETALRSNTKWKN